MTFKPEDFLNLEIATAIAKVANEKLQPPPPPPPPPTKKTVLTPDDIKAAFKGVFALPMFQGEEKSQRMGYSKAVHDQVGDTRIEVSSHPYDLESFALLETPLPFQVTAHPDIPIAIGLDWRRFPRPDNTPSKSGTRNRGILYVPGGRIASYAAYYAVTGEDHPSQSINGAECQTVSGEYCQHNKIAGPLARVPARSEFNNSLYLAGLSGGAGMGTGSWGPAMHLVWRSENDDLYDDLYGSTLICHPESNPSPYWNLASKIRGFAWIETETKHGVIFIETHGVGKIWYGPNIWKDPDTGIEYRDPWHADKGYHAEGYVPILWIYNPEALIQVWEENLDPWTPEPVHRVDLYDEGIIQYYDSPQRKVSHYVNYTMSYKNGRLLIGQAEGYPVNAYENTPLFYGFGF